MFKRSRWIYASSSLCKKSTSINTLLQMLFYGCGKAIINDRTPEIAPGTLLCAKPGQKRSSVFPFRCYFLHIRLSKDSPYRQLLEKGELKVQTLGRGFAWLDTGTHDSLSEASTYIEVLEKRQGLKVACLEGIAYRQGWITEERMRELAQPMIKNQYGQYLLQVVAEVEQTKKANLD